MKAMVAGENGIELREVAAPVAGSGEMLVRVEAVGLNRADLAGVAAKNGKIVGMEWAGEVVAAGPGVKDFAVGERVMCSGVGAYAEYAVVECGRAIAVPSPEMSGEQAAVLNMALLTMHDAIITAGRFKKGDAVLIHGASSGVGLMGLQIARYLGASVVIGTSTHADRRARLGEFGADVALDSTDASWTSAVMEATGGKGVDVIVDQIAGPGFRQTMQAAAIGARIVNVGRLAGVGGEFDFNLHALRRLVYTGVTFRTRSADDVRSITQQMLADLSGALVTGQLSLPVDRVFALEDAKKALAHMASNSHFGKIVLQVAG